VRAPKSSRPWCTATATVYNAGSHENNVYVRSQLAATVTLFWNDRYQRLRRSDGAQAALVWARAQRVLPSDKIRVLNVANRSSEPVYRVNIILEDEYDRDQDGEAVPIVVGSETINTKYVSLLPSQRASRI
jgi:hypothetical protein